MFDSEQVHYAPIEVPEKKKEPSAFSIDDLMTTHIAALFIKAGINDDFDKGQYSFHWKKMLKKERKRLRDAQYYGEANRVLDKIAEINSYNRIDSNTHKKQTKAVTNNDAGSHATKPRKRLKPKYRDRSEGLLLIYEIFGRYEVNYLDDLKGIKAWNKIISKEFTSDYIKDISDAGKTIYFKGGEKLEKADFLEKYRKRFEVE